MQIQTGFIYGARNHLIGDFKYNVHDVENQLLVSTMQLIDMSQPGMVTGLIRSLVTRCLTLATYHLTRDRTQALGNVLDLDQTIFGPRYTLPNLYRICFRMASFCLLYTSDAADE